MYTGSIESLKQYEHGYSAPLPENIAAPDALLDILGPPHRLFPGDHIYRHAELRAGLYWIQRGSIKIYRFTTKGDEQIVNFCFAEDWIGLDAVGTTHHECAAAALETTVVRSIPLSQLDALGQRLPQVYQWLLRLVSCHIVTLQCHLSLLGKTNATERIASFLLHLASRMGAYDFRLSMSRYAIGCYLGLSFETVSRQLHLFEDTGLIRIRGRRVLLLDSEKLRVLTEIDRRSRR